MENTKRTTWSRKDELFVRENPNMDAAEIAGLLGRTVPAITARKSKLKTTGTRHFAPQGGRKLDSPQMELSFGAAGAIRHKPTQLEAIERAMDRYPHTYTGMGITVRSAHKLGWLTKILLMLKKEE